MGLKNFSTYFSALVLLVSVIGATGRASSSNGGVQWRPRPRMEYEFELSGRSLSGLPELQGQFSGMQYSGRVRVQGLTADTAIVKLEKISWSNVHGRLQSSWWAAEPQANETLAGHGHMGVRALPLSGSSAVARFRDGQVQSVLVGRDAKDWEVNLLQGVLSHLQMQSNKQSAGSSAANALFGRRQNSEEDVYRVLENGVSGRCLVQYEIATANVPAQMSAAEAKLCAGKPYVQITKTKNFTDCEEYAEQSRGLPARCSPAGNACASLWARNSITQMIGCGSGSDVQLVQSVSSSSMQAELQTREGSRAAVYSAVNMTLSRVQAVRERIATPKNGIVLDGLGYRVAGKQVTGPWGKGEAGSSSEEDDASSSVEVVRQSSRQRDSDENNSEADDGSVERKKSSKNRNSNNGGDHSSERDGDDARQHKKSQKKQKSRVSDSGSDSNESGSSKQHRHDQDDSGSQKKHSNSHKKGKHSRSPRSAKGGRQDDNDDPAYGEDVFAGALCPAAVKSNSSLRSDLQQRLSQDLNKAAAELNQQDAASSLIRTMERLSMDVRIARALGAEQLRGVRAQLHDQSARELFRDILAMCGSTPCVEETISQIKNGKMNPVASQMALASLADRVIMPSRTILKHVQDLYQSSDDRQVKIAAALALGNLAGRAPRPVAASAASFLAEQMSSESNGKLRTALTLALGETATPQAAQALIKMAKDKKLAPYLRSQAILALRHSAIRAPALVRDSLLSLYNKPSESAAVRIAAVSLLVYARPSLPLWQRLAVSTHYESNLAVASYVWSTIDSFAQLQDPMFLQQTRNARLAKPLARKVPQGAHLAFNVVAASVDAQLDQMVHEHAAFLATVDAANAYYRRITRRAGMSNVDQEMDLWGANPDDLLQAAMDAAFGRQDRATARPVADSKLVPHSTRSIHEKLGIVRRDMQDAQGHLRLTLRPFITRMFLPFDKETPSRFAKGARDFMDKLRSETSFHGQQMGGEELSVSTVTEMGFPVSLRIHAPWLVRADGSAQLHRNNSAYANVTAVYTAGLFAQLSLQSSWSGREYVAAVNGHARVQLPATAVHAHVNASDGRLSVRVERQQRQGAGSGSAQVAALARLNVQPLTAALEPSRGELASESAACHNASRSALAQGAARVAELSPWGEDFSLNLRAPVEHSALPAWIRESRTVLGFPVLGRPLTASRLELLARLPHAMNASFALVKGMMQSGDLQVVYPPALRQNNTDSMGDASPASDSMTSTTTMMPETTTTAAATAAATTTTTSAPSASPIPLTRAMRTSHGRQRASNGSLYVDDGDLDFTRSVFNATTLNPYSNRINGSSELYVLSQVLAGMAAGRGYVLGVNVTSEAGPQASDRTYSGFWTLGANLGGRLMRAGLFARSDSDDAQVAATGAVLRDVPAHADIEAALRQLPALMVKAEYQQIDSTAIKKIVTAVVETDRSFQKIHRLWQAAREQHCVQERGPKNVSVPVDSYCRAVINAANTPDQFNLTINYNNPAENAWGNAVHSALQAVRAYLWNQGNIAVDSLSTGNANELGAAMTIQADGTLDGWLQTPRALTKMVNVAAPTASSFLAATSRETGAFCGVSTNRLLTLDGARGDFRMSGCWHLLAKDCSGKSRVAVLARAANATSLDVEINIDNYQVARLHPNGTATLNGEAVISESAMTGAAVQVRDGDDIDVMDMVRAEDGAIVVSLRDHGLSLVYGNSSVVVQAGTSLRGRMCGMCGNYDGAFTGKMLNPKNEVEKNVQNLAESYAIKGSECRGRQ